MAITPNVYNFTQNRFKATLQQNQPVADDSGGSTDNWVNVLTTRASLVKRSGRLSDGMGKMEYQREYILKCRYQVAIEPAINADTRWLIGGIPYKITDYEREDMRPDYMIFHVTKNG